MGISQKFETTVDEMANCPLFNQLKPKQLHEVGAGIEKWHLSKGESLFKENDRDTSRALF